MKNVLVSWSGGKDSCLALYEIQQAQQHNVVALVTTITRHYERISMHGVRRVLLEQQAESLGLPLHQVLIGKSASNEEYEAKLIEAISSYAPRQVESIVFGDLFLEDIKLYRDRFLARHNLHVIYPIWRRNTLELIKQFINLGFKAIITCVDSQRLDGSFAGRLIDESLLAELPSQIDPCGENGEFHTFVFDGPNFSRPVPFIVGETVKREGFWFCDLLPTGSADSPPDLVTA